MCLKEKLDNENSINFALTILMVFEKIFCQLSHGSIFSLKKQVTKGVPEF